MKCEVKRYGNKLGVKYGIEKSDDGFIIELSEKQIEEIKNTTLYQVAEILNRELYKQTGIAYGEKPKD